MANEARVHRYIDLFEEERRIAVSPFARDLIIMTLDAIESDPNPRWNAPPRKAEDLADRITRDLPDMLAAIVETGRIGEEITYFNVLHFIAQNLKSICPFPTD